MVDLLSNVIRFPRPYRQPPSQSRPVAPQPKRPAPKRLSSRTTPYYEERRELVNVIRNIPNGRMQG